MDPSPLDPRLIVVCRVSTRCNLSCGFCAYDQRLPYPRRDLAEANVTHLIELLARWRGQHAGRRALLSWLGGEPLLWRPWQRFSAQARARGLATSATTNASTLGRDSTRTAVLEHLDELTISVDALGARHDALRGWPGGYARALDAIRTLADRRASSGSAMRLRANIVLMRSTLADFRELTQALAGAGIDEISFNLLGGRDRPEFHACEAVPPPDLKQFLDQLPHLRARLARTGVRLIGGADYATRLLAASRGLPWPIAECAPGERFLFVDEAGRVAPCAFTGDDYGVPIHALSDLEQLPALYQAARSRRCAQACADCPSTQIFGKFSAPDGEHGHRAMSGVVDSALTGLEANAGDHA
jgi:MoaA/NifB/PqqE/SkfB family radical SAM enzyme